MSAALARRYNELAAPEMERHGVAVVDTYTSGLTHAHLSRDGVHAPGTLSRHHAQLFWRQLCEGAERSASLRLPNLARDELRHRELRLA